jgi:Skp family chaperone for outer membrane proteins
MRRLFAVILTLSAALSVAKAEPRFALVDIKSIYSQLPSTLAIQKEVKAKQDALLLDPRADQLRRVITELQSIQAQLQDKSTPLDEETSLKLARNYEIKRQEAQTMQQEFESFRTEQTKLINKEMVLAMRKSLNRIVEVAERLGKEQGFEAVFDRSGATNTGVPFVLYSKNSTDLTTSVLAALKDSERPTTAPANAENEPAPENP